MMVEGRWSLALFLHSQCEPGELSHCSKYDDSIINIVLVIIIISIYYYYFFIPSVVKILSVKNKVKNSVWS